MPYKLREDEALELLRKHGIPVAPYKLARSEDEAVEAARQIGYPVVLKVVSRHVIHKSDVGGVILNLRNDDEVRNAYRKLVSSVAAKIGADRVEGVLVQKMVTDGLEVFIGGVRDPIFGPIVAFGLGGIYVEVYRDVSFKLAPLTRVDAFQAMREVKAWKLLRGYRYSPRDINALADIMVRLSRLLVEHSEVREVDLNPVMVFEEGRGAIVVDARVIVS